MGNRRSAANLGVFIFIVIGCAESGFKVVVFSSASIESSTFTDAAITDNKAGSELVI